MQLNKSELEFACWVQEQANKLLHPVPFILIFPSVIHARNIKAIEVFIEEKLHDVEFMIGVVKCGVNPDNIVGIMMGATGFELWKRATVMRLQWLLEIITLIIIISIL